MRPSGMPRRMKTAQEALRDRLFAGFLARAYRSQAREGMRLLWRAPIRVEEQGWSRIKAMERISEPIIGRKKGSWTVRESPRRFGNHENKRVEMEGRLIRSETSIL